MSWRATSSVDDAGCAGLLSKRVAIRVGRAIQPALLLFAIGIAGRRRLVPDRWLGQSLPRRLRAWLDLHGFAAAAEQIAYAHGVSQIRGAAGEQVARLVVDRIGERRAVAIAG